MPVLAEGFAVIRSDDDQRVLQMPAPLEFVEQPSDLLVEISDRAVVAVNVGLVLLWRRFLSVPAPRSAKDVDAAKAPVIELRSELFVERRGRQTRLVRVQIVEEGEEGALILALQPAQKRASDFMGCFAPDDVVIIDQSPHRVVIENGSAQRRAERELRRRDLIIFVVSESAAEAVFGVAVVSVGDESCGQITVRAERFSQRGVGVIERGAKIRAYLARKSSGEHGGVRRQRPGRGRN